jgi:hypothetical protein
MGLFVKVDIDGDKDEIRYVGCEDLTVVVMKSYIFWDVRLCMPFPQRTTRCYIPEDKILKIT